MSRSDSRFGDPTTQIERLLYAAAEYETGEPVPSGLAVRALALLPARQARRRGAVLLAGAVVALGALVLALAGVGPRSLRGTRVASRPLEIPVLAPVEHPPLTGTEVRGSPAAPHGPADPRRENGEFPAAEGRLPRETPAGGKVGPTRRQTGGTGAATVTQAGRKMGGTRSRTGGARTVRRTWADRKVGPTEPPKARWEVNLVRHEVVGILAPAWLVEVGEERGEWVLTPALLDIPVVAAVGTDELEGDSPSELPITLEENAP